MTRTQRSPHRRAQTKQQRLARRLITYTEEDLRDVGWLYIQVRLLAGHAGWHIMAFPQRHQALFWNRTSWIERQYGTTTMTLCRLDRGDTRWVASEDLLLLPMPWRDSDPVKRPSNAEPILSYCRRCFAVLCEQTHVPHPDPTLLRLSVLGGRKA